MCCRDLNKVKATRIGKPARPRKLGLVVYLLAEDALGPSFLSEEEDDDDDDAMDLDYVLGRAAGRKLPSGGSAKKRTSTRQAGAKRPRQQSPSDEEDGLSLCLHTHKSCAQQQPIQKEILGTVSIRRGISGFSASLTGS